MGIVINVLVWYGNSSDSCRVNELLSKIAAYIILSNLNEQGCWQSERPRPSTGISARVPYMYVLVATPFFGRNEA